jgi:hypothetical protein
MNSWVCTFVAYPIFVQILSRKEMQYQMIFCINQENHHESMGRMGNVGGKLNELWNKW